MKTILKHKSSRKLFLIAVSAILIIILLVRLFVLPRFEVETASVPLTPRDPAWLAIITRLLDSAFVSLTVAVSIGLFIFTIELPEEEKKFEIVEASQLSELFERERGNTEIWYFSGATGSYTRSKTLMELSKIAKSTNRHKTVKLQIIDPSNTILCEKYAQFRRSLRSGKESEWNAKSVRNKTIATIVTTFMLKSSNALMHIEICLKNTYSTMRIDLSSHAAIITNEDPKASALVCRNDSILYRTYLEEILQTFKIHTPITTPYELNIKKEALDVNRLKEFLLGINLLQGLDDSDFSEILKTVKENKNDYERTTV